MSDKPKEVRFNIQASPERMCGCYANASIVSTSNAESRIDFLYVDNANKQGNDVPAHLVARVIMPTTSLADLSETLSKHLSKHLEQGM